MYSVVRARYSNGGVNIARISGKVRVPRSGGNETTPIDNGLGTWVRRDTIAGTNVSVFKAMKKKGNLADLEKNNLIRYRLNTH